MNYRFLKFTTIYPAFMSKFIAKNQDYKKLSYQELYSRFIHTRYGWSDFYARHLERIGNESEDLFASVEFLQKAWAAENGVKYRQETWAREIVLAQIRAFRPDVIYFQDLYFFDQDFRQQVRGVCGRHAILIGWRSAPTSDFTVFNDLDMVLTASPEFVELLRRNGAKAVYHPHGFEETLLREIPARGNRDLDFTFVGTVGKDHSERSMLIGQLLDATTLHVWTDPLRKIDSLARPVVVGLHRFLSSLGMSNEVSAKLPLIRRATSPALKLWTHHGKRLHSSVFGLEYYDILSRSKVAFNCHIDVAESYAGNMRLFEATGMGACLLTDWKPNLREFFEPDTEVVTHRTAAECIEKVRYLLEHDSERKAIAEAGQRRVLRDHTLRNRVERLHECIADLIRARRVS